MRPGGMTAGDVNRGSLGREGSPSVQSTARIDARVALPKLARSCARVAAATRALAALRAASAVSNFGLFGLFKRKWLERERLRPAVARGVLIALLRARGRGALRAASSARQPRSVLRASKRLG